MQLHSIDPLGDPNWDRLVAMYPDATAFHSSAWAKVLFNTYRHTPHYLRVSDGGQTVALVPLMSVNSWLTGRRGVCLPFSDFCAPLISAGVDSKKLLSLILTEAEKNSWKYVEWRHDTMADEFSIPAKSFFGHTLDLQPGADALFGSFEGSVRRAIRKAERSHIRLEIGVKREAMERYYHLHLRTRQRLGVPSQPFSFFMNIWKELLKPGLGFIVTAFSHELPAASAVFLCSNTHAIYKFGASDERFQENRVSNLVIWEAIKLLVSDGVKILHFGRTATENLGLRRFKCGWGVREFRIRYFKSDRTRSGSFNVPAGLVRRLPMRLNRLAGALLYPHLD